MHEMNGADIMICYLDMTSNILIVTASNSKNTR